MVLTITEVKKGVMGDRRYTVKTIAFDSSYPTGGEPLTLGDLGLVQADIVMVESEDGYTFEYDYANSKLKAYTTAATEVVNTTDLTGLTAVRVMSIGR